MLHTENCHHQDASLGHFLCVVENIVFRDTAKAICIIKKQLKFNNSFCLMLNCSSAHYQRRYSGHVMFETSAETNCSETLPSPTIHHVSGR